MSRTLEHFKRIMFAPRRRESAPQTFREKAKEFIKSAITAVIMAIFLKMTLMHAYAIPTGSMAPTVVPKDRVFANMLVYKFRSPERGEIITFNPPEEVAKYDSMGNIIPYLKRVVAVEGDVVSVREGNLYVNGQFQDEPYLDAPVGYIIPPVEVPEGMLFVLGDNRLNSNDSHIWGFLPKENVEAKAFFRFWPPERLGVLK